MTPLAARVKALRRSRGLSQAQLGTMAGIPQTSISNIEGGKTGLPSADQRRRLAAALETSNVELLLAAREVDEGELIAWAHQSGFIRQAFGDDEPELTRLATELATEDSESPRVALALRIPAMTRQEAAYLKAMFECLPTEAHAQRRVLTPEEYRRWRDRQDVKIAV